MTQKWIALALVLLAFGARAEAPAGAYGLEVPAVRGLAVPSGEAVDCNVRDEIERCISLTLETAPTGTVTGTGALTLEEFDDVFTGELAVTVEGEIGGSVDLPKASLRYELAGQLVESGPDPNTPGRVLDAAGSGRFACKLHPLEDELLRCKGSARFCVDFEGRRIGCMKIPFVLPVEIERLGFDVALDLETAENGQVSGEASCAIEGDPTFTYTARGKYNERSDASKLALTGVDPAAKTKLTLKGLKLEEGGAVAFKMRFQVSGQRGTLELVEPASLSAPAGD